MGADPLAEDSKAATWFSTGLRGAACSACGGGAVESLSSRGTSGRMLALVRGPDGAHVRTWGRGGAPLASSPPGRGTDPLGPSDCVWS